MRTPRNCPHPQRHPHRRPARANKIAAKARPIKSNKQRLTFGADWGTVAVSLGETKVLTHVTCDLGAPTTSRPNEGKLQLNVNLGGVAFLDEVQSTHDQRSLTLNSLLERTFRSSRCVDLESLCVAAEQHVWCIRVDINVLNHDGNLYGKCTNLPGSSYYS